MQFPQMDDEYQVDLPALFVWYCHGCRSFICGCEGQARLESQFGIVQAIHDMQPAEELSENIVLLDEDSMSNVLQPE